MDGGKISSEERYTSKTPADVAKRLGVLPRADGSRDVHEACYVVPRASGPRGVLKTSYVEGGGGSDEGELQDEVKVIVSKEVTGCHDIGPSKRCLVLVRALTKTLVRRERVRRATAAAVMSRGW